MASKNKQNERKGLCLSIIAVGKVRNDPTKGIFDLYASRLPWRFKLIEIQEGGKYGGPERVKREGLKLISAIPDKAIVVALDENGKKLKSLEFAEMMKKWLESGNRKIAFIIGGADGLSQSVFDRADLIFSLGDMTWPHMLVRSMLAEQLWRSASIINKHPYHRL